MYIGPEYLRSVTHFDRTQFRPVPVSRDARKRTNVSNPSDIVARPS